MTDNSFQTQYDITKKSRLRQLYDTNKVIIYSILSFVIICVIAFNYHLDNKKKEKAILSDQYIQGKIYLETGNKDEAKKILKEVIYSNDPTYSTLSFFLILNENLVDEDQELLEMFTHIIENNSYDPEVKNLLIFKKALFSSNFIEESKLLNELKPLIKKESLWKPYALLLLGDYFYFKKEFLKAREFYVKILELENLQAEVYNQAKSKLASLKNEN
jgi:tetratricopeptide (TPR) repeat protein